ncbi:MAG TPA: glycosyltransferase family 4 protein [Candidatus Nanoarchaeia archaeon]|nr:glycosyltransferase family 4 protein [Candidatus Nanoarchaeia archaeon]
MKILMINDSFDAGGAETYMKNLGDALRRRGHSVHYFAFGKKFEHNGKLLIYQESGSKFARYFFKFFLNKKICFGLVNFIKKINPDIIHIHNVNKYPLAVLKALKESKIPVVQTVHDFGLVCPDLYSATKEKYKICTKGVTIRSVFSGCTPWYAYLPLKILYYKKNSLLQKSVRKFIAPSKLLKKTLEENGFRNCVLVHHFINIHPTKKKNNKILFVGALKPNKGVDVLIKSISKTSSKTSAEAEIVGDGPERKKLEKLAEELGIRKKIRFFGELNNSETIKKLGSVKVLVFPSIALENSPMTIYEAMASKTLVIASDIGGISDLVENNKTGFLFYPGDADELAKKISFALTKNTKKIVDNAFEKSRKDYNEGKHIKKIIEIYNEAIENGKKK